ncbi:MAG: hypothetical protein RH946_17545 [Rhodospirillales bacterium]
MLTIGIDSNSGLLYEGTGVYNGRAVWPLPFISQACITYASDGLLKAENSSIHDAKGLRFREDYFDPISRIRRGRFYTASTGGAQPAEWHVQPHPATPLENVPTDRSGIVKRLYTFHNIPNWETYLDDRKEQPLVLLGAGESFTVWSVVDVERIATGEDLVTLKARRSFGILPVVDYAIIGKEFREPLRECLDALIDEARRASPTSVIDRARDAASQALLIHYKGKVNKDLGELAKRIEGDGLIIAACASKIIARLHARAKPAERSKRELLSIREQDAELAIQCVGTILCELGLGKWV